jgi:hypothetical protein
MASDDPERIWLEPGDGAPDTGRLWCRDDVWTGDLAYEGELPTEYVRADIHAARVAELEAALRGLLHAPEHDTDLSDDKCPACVAIAEAVQALEGGADD